MILTGLYSSILRYQLVTQLYPATEADLYYSFYTSELGVVLKVRGYNQKLHLIVEAFVKAMKTVANNATEEQFRVFWEEKFKDYANVFINPASLGHHLRELVLEKHKVSLLDKRSVLKSIKFADFRQFCGEFLNEVRIESLMQGNVTEQMAKGIMENVLKVLDCGNIQDVSF